ncbi:hypothetical protein SDC9_188785 [bioreactor metagenome]|uniref:Uncharacterized protein n=1 Tax=bioreactor metagenome TaxID=1076179 RepID=A0A645I154_9ZZZZ
MAVIPPPLLSLIPPVSGLLAPMLILFALETVVPVKKPFSIIILFSVPRGSQRGFTSFNMIFAIRPLPPVFKYSSDAFSYVICLFFVFTLKIVSIFTSIKK